MSMELHAMFMALSPNEGMEMLADGSLHSFPNLKLHRNMIGPTNVEINKTHTVAP